MKINKSFLKWAGGKSKLLPTLLTHIGTPDVFVEPFCGSGVVWLNVESDRYIINDVNNDLISLFKILKEAEKNGFVEYAQTFFTEENNIPENYYALRDRFNSLEIGSVDRAAIFIYLNRHSFNGLCRYNKSGKFNVLHGKYKNPQFPIGAVKGFVDKCKKVEFFNESFETIFQLSNDIPHEKNVVIYCDPPYVPLNETSHFTSYAPGTFGLAQQQLLADCAKSSSHKVVISNSDTSRTRS